MFPVMKKQENKEAYMVNLVATSPIRESAVSAAKYEETNVYLVATSPIRESAVSAAKYEETNNVYLVAISPIRESAVLAAKYEETNNVYLVATSPIRESAVLAAKYDVNLSNTNVNLSLSNANIDLNLSNEKTYKTLQRKWLSMERRSRYMNFTVFNNLNTVHHSVHRISKRGRAPSRIPVKKISRLLDKSRKVRKLVRKYIKKDVPRSSHIHRLLHAFSHERKKLLIDRVIYLPYFTSKKSKVFTRYDLKSGRTLSYNERVYRTSTPKMSTRALIFKANDSFECAYESLNHRINCCKFNLCNDIEKNPGPTFIDPNKTLCAPYSQDFIDVFGVNAGKQCVGMSLCALLYKYRKGTITYSADLIMIMDMGNELYSMLSRITGQMYLLLTELPETLTVEEVNYGLHFSESYSGQLHNLAFNEDIPHVMPLQYAFENLLQEGYISFLLTIGYNTVSIFTIANGFFKVFDSHGRDSCGMADPTGTCVLLEVNSILYLVEYFRTSEVKRCSYNYSRRNGNRQ